MFFALTALLACSSGVEVTVVNQTEAPLRAVSVEVTGAQQPIGDVAAGAEATVRVEPVSESSVTVRGEGFEETYGYIEPGYRGGVTFVMSPSGAVVRDETKLPWP